MKRLPPVVRGLLRTPRVSFVVVATLALGVALVTTFFTVINGYAWATLPYADADEIVALGVAPDYPGARLGTVPRPVLDALRGEDALFSHVAGYRVRTAALGVGDASVPVQAVEADDAFHRLLRPALALGRVPATGEVDVAVLSHRLWHSRFGADAGVRGTTLRFDGLPVTVIGVFDAGFGFEHADLFVSPGAHAAAGEVEVLARLRPDVTPAAAAARIAALRLEDAGGQPLRLALSPDMAQRPDIMNAGPLLLLFLGGTLFVLLIACANVVAVLLARGVAQRAQVAVRAALGASRRRLALEALAESAVLGATAAVLGLLLSIWTIDVLVALLPAHLPDWLRFTVDLRVLAFTAAVATCTVFLLGVLPARAAANVDLLGVMKTGVPGFGVGNAAGALASTGRLIVIGEVALAVALFIGVTLMVRSFSAMQRVDPGYDDDAILAATPHFDERRFAAADRIDAYLDAALETARRLPGVEAASWHGRFDGWRTGSETADGASASFYPAFHLGGRRAPDILATVVGPDYLPAHGLSLLRGRGFSAGDHAGAPAAVLLSEAAARRLFPGVEALGSTLPLDSAGTHTAVVVGIASDRVVLRSSRGGVDARPQADVYFTGRQVRVRRPELLVHAADPQRLTPLLRAALYTVDRDVPLQRVETLDVRNAANAASTRIMAALFGAIAASALLLSVIGMYGVISYAAQQRTREIGVRIALGASPERIRGEVVGGALRLAATGALIGALLALALTRLMRMLLYGVQPFDPLTYAVVAVVFGGIATAAAYAPGRRAMKVEPMAVLRSE